ncbi:BPSL0761 family protein [Rhodoferax sp.]|uniref:BPSL0761 family protein n=1 Tax=Rhodoferax sp. TaxID=50421 RepID=UPI001EC8D972|nr:BPSL0761 family protein [Rhodoferax sp.]MBT9508194.1 hypothetical protein [Rhodoferax sp.]
MTMPHERTRAVRYGWEYLIELQESGNITEDQRHQIESILRHYPSGGEIKFSALDCVDTEGPCGPKMSPEHAPISSRSPLTPEFVERGTTTPSERTRALLLADQLFKELLSAPNLTPDQKRQIPYVLRHFPDRHEIKHWAQMDAWMKSQNPNFKPWLAPESMP